MYAQEQIKPYKGNAHKREQVELLFDNIAPTYDTLNHTLSFGFDRCWRRRPICRREVTDKPQRTIKP